MSDSSSSHLGGSASLLSPLSRTQTNELTSHSYTENDPTIKDWINKQCKISGSGIKHRLTTFLPFLEWIYRYNFIWFWSDLIAGLTVGAVVIPQGMAYAGLAKLPPQFGLYSSFVGVIIYWLFATSKDITIGPVAVVSALVGSIVDTIRIDHSIYEPHQIASALCLLAGGVIFIFGIFRLGFIVDFIPSPALAAFMTGSALTIAMGQVPVMMGTNKLVNTRDPTYSVFLQFWQQISHVINLNAVLGISSLVLLYTIRFICEHARKRYPTQEKIFFFINTLRVVFVILVFLFVSWLINHEDPTHPRTSFLGTIPSGFQNIGVPYMDRTLFSLLISYLPATVIVLLIEHVAIAKSFGRINNYNIDSNQEMIAIGVTNTFGPFFGAYPATGSFSRTAIKSKAGVKTPLAGIFSGLLIVLGIYALTGMFYWISQSSLAAVIIHAVCDLIVGLDTLKVFWRVNPVEFFIFWIGVIVTIFTNIENGIYTTTLSSIVLLLFRISKARGSFLGQVQIQRLKPSPIDHEYRRIRNIYVPLDHSDGSNPMIVPASPAHGIFIYRINESLLFPNTNAIMECLTERIMRETKSGKVNHHKSIGEQPWNLKTSRHPERDRQIDDQRPILHALILDFTGVAHLDVTGLQSLVDIRQQLDRYANRKVFWHFVGLSNPWLKRALISGGFGSLDDSDRIPHSAARVQLVIQQDDHCRSEVLLPIFDTNRLLFHADIDEAYETAMSCIQREDTAISQCDETPLNTIG